MSEPLKLLAVLAHPDDESLAMGGTLVRYAAEGIETCLVTATRGERGWWGAPEDYPGLAGLGRLREAELRAAAQVLGLREVHYLDYIDGDLDQADPGEAVARIAEHVRRIRPQVVVTFDPAGAYGHPDHIAVSQFTAAALVAAAAPASEPNALPPHRVAKFYYFAGTKAFVAAYQQAFGDLVMRVDGVERRAAGWEPWAVTTEIDTEAHWRTAWQAVACHRSQLPGYSKLQALPEQHHRGLWGCQNYYRVYSTVNGGRALETDLFAGLRG
jgi:LmbE family N-acetylglucosaminyl deacetylase